MSYSLNKFSKEVGINYIRLKKMINEGYFDFITVKKFPGSKRNSYIFDPVKTSEYLVLLKENEKKLYDLNKE